MGTLAWLFGFLGGACAVMGIITAVEIVPLLAPQLTWMFWLVLAAVLSIICVACAVRHTGYE